MEEQSSFYRDTWAEVDLDHISKNIQSVKKLLPENVDIFAVVKANAYGHGDLQVARTALKAGAAYLAVAFMDEAIALRNKGITAPILVLGAARAEDSHIAASGNITLTVFQTEWLEAAKEYLKDGDVLPVHIKIDTGMGRLGVRNKEELKKVEEWILENKHFHLEGVFTHFATADELDPAYFETQLASFEEMLNAMKDRPKYVHSSNSAAAIRFPKAYFNAVRLGIAMYGLTPSLEMESEIPFPLQEALSLRTKLVHVKQLHKGDKVSYGATYEAKEGEWIGTIPIGYADGWIRRLQGQEVLIDGKRSPIVGRICMDQCMIHLPYDLPVGTTVTLIGQDHNECISINEIARKLDTINYEIPCMIAGRVPRIYKEDGSTIGVKNDLLDGKQD